MSSLPSEVLEDVLQPLDRWTLDTVQFTDGRFLQLIVERMTNVCLRQIHNASFQVSNDNMEESFYGICIDPRFERFDISKTHKDTARMFSEFVQALQSSRVAFLYLYRLFFTPELGALVLQAPIVVDAFSLVHSSCAELTATQLHKILLHFSPTSMDFNNSHLRSCQITNGFLRALSKNRMLRTLFPRKVPVDGGSFCATDDAVVDFCMQPDVQIGPEGDAPKSNKPYRALVLYHGRFTKALFKRLVEASAAYTPTQPLRIFVSPVPTQDEDLRDFAEYLWYRRHSGTVYQLRIYNFGDPSDAPVDLQIVLHSENDGLELIRAPRSSRFFYK
ncbi:hypothetical protein AAVH_09432 [Aphelenchoides avenae]|nr:hypothetical protein AAVH_09432 [Aphelenchus avenae]